MSWSELAIVVALLVANAFFVGAEFAIISARRSAIEPLAESGSKRAVKVLAAMEEVSLMLACSQLGITLCSVALGAIAEPAIAHAIEPYLASWGVAAALVHPIAIVIALLIVVSLHVVLGEMVPKNAAVSTPERAALIFGPPLLLVAKIVKPVIWALNALANLLLRLVGIQVKQEISSAFTAGEVQSIVELSSEEGTISDSVDLLTGALEFSAYQAKDVMVPLTELVTIDINSTLRDFELRVAEHGYSRLPVVEDGQYLGYLHLKDALYTKAEEQSQPLKRWKLRGFSTVALDTDVELVLAQMQTSGSHVAAVYRGEELQGLVFLEDVIEELVGEVKDTISREESAT